MIERLSMHPAAVVALTILAGLWQAPSASATTIVAIRVDSMVVLAADSFQLDLGGQQAAERSACKIVRVGNSAAASAGVTRFEGFFDVNQLARDALSGRGPFTTRVETFGRKLSEAVRRALREPRAAAELYRIVDRTGGRLVTALFVGFEDGSPRMVWHGYRVSAAVAATAEAGLLRSTRACPSQECSVDLYSAGRADAIYEALKRDRRLVEGPEGPVAIVKQLVGLEIQAAPHLVATPIDALTIDGKGVASWVEGTKPQCMRPRT
jgi:hypothetical protein